MMRHVHRALRAFGTREDKKEIVVAGSLVVTALCAAFVLPQSALRGPRVPKLDAPELSAFIPAGATVASAALEVPELPQSDYAFAYAMNGKAFLGGVRWDKDTARYAAVQPVEMPGQVAGVPTLALVHPGSGMAWVAVRVPVIADAALQGDSADAGAVQGERVSWYAVAPAGFAPVRVLAHGTESVAEFPVLTTARFTEDVAVRDVTNDGTAEVVTTTTEMGESGVHTGVSVWRWNGSVLEFDGVDSETLSASRALFPQ